MGLALTGKRHLLMARTQSGHCKWLGKTSQRIPNGLGTPGSNPSGVLLKARAQQWRRVLALDLYDTVANNISTTGPALQVAHPHGREQANRRFGLR